MSNELYPALPHNLSPYAEGNLEEGMILEVGNRDALVRGVRFRIATMNDLDDLYAVEQATWPTELALPREEIEESINSFSGLQILATEIRTNYPVGWASVTRVDSEVAKGDANHWEENIHANIKPTGNSFEGLGIAVVESERGYHLGQALIIFAARAAARNLTLENREDKPFVYRLTGRASGYGKWLEERRLEHTIENFGHYVQGIKEGKWRDSVLFTNFGVVAQSQGLVEELELVPNSWPKDTAARGAGVRFDRTNLTRAFIPVEQRIKDKKTAP